MDEIEDDIKVKAETNALLKRSIELLESGMGYRGIRNYLKDKTDEDTQEQIVKAVIEHENTNGIQERKDPHNPDSNLFYQIFGFAMIFFGAGMVLVFWGTGWVSIIPFAMVGLGIKTFLDNS